MREFNFTMDSMHQELLDKILSGLLPHENFEAEVAAEVLTELFRVLPKHEVYGINYIFYNLFENLKLIPMYRKGYRAQISAEMFHAAVEVNIDEFIKSRAFNATQYFLDRGVEYNLTEPLQYSDAVNFICSEADETYDRLIEAAVATSEGLSHTVILKDAIRRDITEQIIRISSEIVANSFKGKTRMFRGAREASEFAQLAFKEVTHRFDTSTNVRNRFISRTIGSYDTSLQFDNDEQLAYQELFRFGWEPVDAVFRPSTGDIITFIAPEGTGKTRLSAHLTWCCIIAGVNINVLCGETPKKKFKRMVEAAHLYHLYQVQLSPAEMDNLTLVTTDYKKLEEYSMLIKAAKLDLYNNEKFGKMSLMTTMYYEECYNEQERLILEQNVSVFITDHTKSLSNNGTMTTAGKLKDTKTSIDFMIDQQIALAQEYPVAFINFSHPSVSAQDALLKGKDPGYRASGTTANVTQGSSFVGILNASPDQRQQDMVEIFLNKLRDAPIPVPSILLQRMGYGQHHVYRAEIQYLLNRDSDKVTDAIFAKLTGDSSAPEGTDDEE